MTKFKVLEDTNIRSFLEGFYLSKANIYKILSAPYYINGNIIKANVSKTIPLKQGDEIIFDLSFLNQSALEPYKFNLNIIYEDEYILAVNKPIDMLTHPDGNRNDTLANAVSFYYLINSLDISVRIIHRLDYQTSGIVVFAKDALSQSFLNNQIEKRIFKKDYIAIVEGLVQEPEGIIDFPIGRNRHDARKYLVSKTGKDAITKFKVLDKNDNRTKLLVNIETGRTHQIRVHLSYLNHPIVGDELYGKPNNRMYLHASSVEFIHPNTRRLIKIKSNPKDGEHKWIL